MEVLDLSPNEERELDIKIMRNGGYSYSAIARKWGLSKQRVYQIFAGYRTMKPELSRKIKCESGACELCGDTDIDKLDIHHNDLNPLNNDITNLSVVCVSCHKELHRGQIRNFPAREKNILKVRRLLVRLTDEQFKKLKRELILRDLTVQSWLEGVVEEFIKEKEENDKNN